MFRPRVWLDAWVGLDDGARVLRLELDDDPADTVLLAAAREDLPTDAIYLLRDCLRIHPEDLPVVPSRS